MTAVSEDGLSLSAQGHSINPLSKKITAYWQAWQDKAHVTAFGFKQIRVLIVTKSDERISNLQALTARLKLIPNLQTM